MPLKIVRKNNLVFYALQSKYIIEMNHNLVLQNCSTWGT